MKIHYKTNQKYFQSMDYDSYLHETIAKNVAHFANGELQDGEYTLKR